MTDFQQNSAYVYLVVQYLASFCYSKPALLLFRDAVRITLNVRRRLRLRLQHLTVTVTDRDDNFTGHRWQPLCSL